MSDLRELYQEVILDHGKRPRNFRVLEGADRTAEGYNPLCGDKVVVYLTLRDGIITDVAFQGAGCAISTASASMMTARLKGRSVAEAERTFEIFHRMITGGGRSETGAGPGAGTAAGRNASERAGADGSDTDTDGDALGSLQALAGVREFPMRVKCASLAWHTLRAALHGKHAPITTE